VQRTGSLKLIQELNRPIIFKTIHHHGHIFHSEIAKRIYISFCELKSNNFISSPLIENRLISCFTYYFWLDGFHRRDHAIWPNDLWNRPSYKFPIWKAGDKFFVYPRNDGNLICSTHWENLWFGIQDYRSFLVLKERVYDLERIRKKFLQSVLGDLDEMESTKEKVKINYSLD